MSSIRSPRTAGRAARAIRLRSVALVSALATLAVAAPAHANLSAVGPVDPSTQVPAWFQDASGLKLGLCLTGPFCLSTAAEFAAPDGEAFYFNAGADLTINGSGTAKLVLAQEAVGAPSGPAAFMRARVVLTGAVPNTSYTVRYPYGTMTIDTDATGGGKDTHDFGCTAAPCPAFGGALTGEIGPFLTWTPDAALPAGHIGDGLTPHTVTGGTNGNSFTVAGPGGATTNLFTVAGELAGPPVPVINSPSAVDFGSSPVGVPVEKTITVRSFGVPGAGSDLNITPAVLGGAAPGAYRLVANSCAGAFSSGQACAVTVQFVPTAGGAQPAALNIPSNATGGNGTVALTGTGVASATTAAGGGVAGAGARSRFALRTLRTTHRLTRAHVRSHGLRFTMRLPQGTEIVKVSVLRVRNGKALRKPVWFAFRHPSRSGLYRMRLNTRKLRHRLTPGLYQVNITPGVSKRQLGATSSTRIRITRR